MKKQITVYVAALLSPGSFGIYTLDDVYCFTSKEKREEWRLVHTWDCEVDYFEDKIEIEV